MTQFPIKARLAKKCYNRGFSCSFNISTDQTEIPAFRAVVLSSEAITADGEAITDNSTVSLPGGVTAVGGAIGVVSFGGDNAPLTTDVYPGILRDANVTVQLDQTFPIEVEPGQVITKGSLIQVNAVGQAAAAGTATGLLAMESSTGAGTVSNPEYVVALINQLTA